MSLLIIKSCAVNDGKYSPHELLMIQIILYDRAVLCNTVHLVFFQQYWPLLAIGIGACTWTGSLVNTRGSWSRASRTIIRTLGSKYHVNSKRDIEVGKLFKHYGWVGLRFYHGPATPLANTNTCYSLQCTSESIFFLLDHLLLKLIYFNENNNLAP